MRTTRYTFNPAGFDVFDRRASQPETGTLVVKTKVYGAPPNGTCGHCYVKDAETGQFYGLVLTASLTPTKKGA